MEVLIYLLVIVIFGVISLGIFLKILTTVMNIFSLPTYIGLMYFEDIHNNKNLKINKPPKNGFLRLMMNIFASIITVSFIIFVINILNFSSTAEGFMHEFITGKIISSRVSSIIITSLIAIYIINYFSEENTEDSFTKINNLDLKPFWKLWK